MLSSGAGRESSADGALVQSAVGMVRVVMLDLLVVPVGSEEISRVALRVEWLEPAPPSGDDP